MGNGAVLRPTTDPRVMMQDPRIQLGQLQQAVQRLSQDNARLAAENDGMKLRMKHFTGILIAAIQTHFGGKEVRIPKAAMENIKEGLGINSRMDRVSEEMVVEILTQKEFQIMMAGLQLGQFDATVPRKAPFKVKVQLPEGGTFQGPELVVYRGGKSAGIELTFVQGKPKKVREFTVDKDGVFTFTADSQGMDVAIQFLVRMPVERTDEEEEALPPLDCDDGFHRDKDAPGIRCSKCGDSRKLPEAEAVQV